MPYVGGCVPCQSDYLYYVPLPVTLTPLASSLATHWPGACRQSHGSLREGCALQLQEHWHERGHRGKMRIIMVNYFIIMNLTEYARFPCGGHHGSSVANWRNTHTHMDRTPSLTRLQPYQHSYNHVVRSPSSFLLRMSPWWSLCILYLSHARWSYRRQLGSLLLLCAC